MLDLCRLLLLKTVSGGSGGGMNWNGISGVSVDISNQTVDTDNAVFDFGSLNVTFVAKKLTSTQNDTSIEIKCNHLTFGTGAFNDLSGSSKIRTVILSCANHPNTPSEFTRNGKIARFLENHFSQRIWAGQISTSVLPVRNLSRRIFCRIGSVLAAGSILRRDLLTHVL